MEAVNCHITSRHVSNEVNMTCEIFLAFIEEEEIY